jgi:hypothetical protein
MYNSSGLAGTDINIVEHSHDKDVEIRVPPSHYNPWTIRLGDVRRPEHSHKPIMLYHVRNSLAIGRLGTRFRRILVVVAVLGQRHLSPVSWGAAVEGVPF